MQEESYLSDMRKAHYKIVGNHNHSAVKLCHWTRQSLLNGRHCYKQEFYGIKSHRCLQMTPWIHCQQECVFCWRFDGTGILEKQQVKEWDSPEEIIEDATEAQRVLLQGYYGVLDRVDETKLKQAENPNQVAISLTGEPTMYPELSGLITKFHKRDFTTFLVTNGLLPGRIKALKEDLPTQFYLSLDAPTKELQKKIDLPLIKRAWERINESLELMPSLDTRRVVRITLVKGWNDTSPEKYARLIEKSETDFVEVKAFMLVGGSRKRLTIENMPRHEEIVSFAKSVAEHLPGYELVNEKPDSRAALLSNGAKPERI
jgi:tRNA wybutosine-synthesizing protein 1